jgi:hypothetical protein
MTLTLSFIILNSLSLSFLMHYYFSAGLLTFTLIIANASSSHCGKWITNCLGYGCVQLTSHVEASRFRTMVNYWAFTSALVLRTEYGRKLFWSFTKGVIMSKTALVLFQIRFPVQSGCVPSSFLYFFIVPSQQGRLISVPLRYAASCSRPMDVYPDEYTYVVHQIGVTVENCKSWRLL